MVFCKLISCSLLVTLLAGCGSQATVAEDPPQKADAIAIIETAPIPAVLPAEYCFVAIHDYDLMLMGENLGDSGWCSRLADRLFPEAAQLPWSPKEVDNPDRTTECALARSSERLGISLNDHDQQGRRFERALNLADRACEALREEGWTDHDEALTVPRGLP